MTTKWYFRSNTFRDLVESHGREDDVDFYRIVETRNAKTGVLELYPDFVVGKSRDLMIRGKSFHAVWDEVSGLWSTDEYDVVRLVDAELKKASENHAEPATPKYLASFGNGYWTKFKTFCSQIGDSGKDLDSKLVFKSDPPKKSDHASRRLSYDLIPGDYSAWDELVGYLYSPEERAKIEWAIGAIVSGDSKKIQKFICFYGPPGTGKSTILGIFEKLFEDYVATFDAKSLGSANASFAMEVLKSNPLVAIQHDGDLSKMDDNTRLNSLIAHEPVIMNEKHKAAYTFRPNSFLLFGTNQPVKISDAKSGIIRRLIDVNPTGKTLGFNRYQSLMTKVDFQLGAIAAHCLEVYREMGRNFYDSYRPTELMFATDPFLNFVEANLDELKAPDGISLRRAYELYKAYCDNSGMKALPQYKIREELKSYFDTYHERKKIDGVDFYSLYFGFNFHKYGKPTADSDVRITLSMDSEESLLDTLLAGNPAQYAKENGTPEKRWDDVTTKLADIDTHKLHYVKVRSSHIVIDFDLKDAYGKKSLEKNLEAASGWPATYAEFSKSGAGVHLHYDYAGDVDELAKEFSPGIEIKVYKGNSSLRRRLTKCNTVPVATIHDGLPTKEKRVIESDTMQSERGVRDLIARNLNKEFHPGTKPSVDFIRKILDDAYESGMPYDVSDLRPTIVAFANNSSNQSLICLKTVQQMKFKSLVDAPPMDAGKAKDERLVFFDVEVYPNLFMILWKYAGDSTVVRMINPEPHEVEALFGFKLVGFNNRRYDAHILYARFMGYSNEGLYKLSQKIVNNEIGAYFGEAFDLCYADIYDFSSKKQTLKAFEIELGLPHIELDLPWDEPVPEDQWGRVADYCCNDVLATEAVFEARRQDFNARKILAELSGLPVIATTRAHATKIMFGNDRTPQKSFVYTDLATGEQK
jgi:hypothetical protein